MSKWERFGPYVKGILGAVIGLFVVVFVVHTYQDHQALHQLVGFVNAYGTRIEALPPTPVGK